MPQLKKKNKTLNYVFSIPSRWNVLQMWFSSDGFLLETFCLTDISIKGNEISVLEPTSPF